VDELVRLIIASLACFRISELITVDDGPGNILLRMRAKLGGYGLGEDGEPETSLGRGIICPWCVGIWIAAGLAVLLFPVGPMIVIYWLAIAGGQALLQGIAGRV
jgi:hypothetical protein